FPGEGAVAIPGGARAGDHCARLVPEARAEGLLLRVDLRRGRGAPRFHEALRDVVVEREGAARKRVGDELRGRPVRLADAVPVFAEANAEVRWKIEHAVAIDVGGLSEIAAVLRARIRAHVFAVGEREHVALFSVTAFGAV